MSAKEQRNWREIFVRAREWAEEQRAAGKKPVRAELARFLDIPSSSILSAMDRYGLTMETLHEYVEGQCELTEYETPEEGDRIERRENGNYVEISSRSVTGQIKTVEELIEASQFDLEKYRIERPKCRKWDVAIKVKDGMGERIEVVPLHYVAFEGMLRHPEPIAPVIAPVTFADAGVIPKARRSRKKIQRALIVPDAQVGFRRRLHTAQLTPFHDRRALDIALQILQDGAFEFVQYIGDMLDMSEWSSRFPAEPEFYWTTQPALIELSWWLRQYREAAPNAQMDYFEGNHDMRPKTAITTHLKAAYGIKPVDELELPVSLSVPRLLALHELHVNYVESYPDAKRWLNRNVLIRHGHLARANPGDTAKAVANKYRYTTIFGHVHRRELVTVRMQTRNGDEFATGFCPGCVCHIDGRVPGSTSEAQWQQGLAVVEFTEDSENIVPIAVNEGRAIYNGKLYEAREREEEIDGMLMSLLDKINC